MSIGLGLNLSPDLAGRGAVLARLSQHLGKGFSDRTFPKGMEKIAIGIICVDPRFDFFFKPKPPKLTKNKIHKEGGMETQLGDVFEYEIKLDYAKAKTLNEDQFIEFVKKALLDSFETIDQNLYDGSGEFRDDFYSVVEAFR
jgi:hypothetical protein